MLKHLITSFWTLAIGVMAFGQYNIGHTTITFNDPSRTGGVGTGGGPGRQIETDIYYPGTTTGDDVACIADSFPVIVFGHGFAMTWDAYQNIWEHYVPLGYILAFPRTEESLSPGPSHGDFAEDLKVVATRMQLEHVNTGSIFENHVKVTTALMGHSMGGGASALAASGNTSIKTYVGLAPAETTPSAITAASGISVPSIIFSGAQDGVTPPADHHIPIYNGISASCKTFVSILGGGHCYYANTNFFCDFGEGASSTGISITRQEQQDRTYAILDHWLRYTLWNECNGLDAALTTAQNTTSHYTSQSTCSPIGGVSINETTGTLTASVSGNSYQWYLNGNPISGANAMSYTPTTNGDYTVEVEHASGCLQLSDPYTMTSLGVNYLHENQLNAYPVPATEVLTIKGLQSKMAAYEIWSNDGKLVDQGNSTGTINLSHLTKGSYMLKIEGKVLRIAVNR